MRRDTPKFFWHTLALELGYTVEELQHLISWNEFEDWRAYDRLEPIGPRREDFQAALIASCIVNAHSKRKVTPSDLMPKWGGAAEKPTPAQVKAKFMAFALTHNAALARTAKRTSAQEG